MSPELKKKRTTDYEVELSNQLKPVRVRAAMAAIENGGCLAFSDGDGWTLAYAPSEWRILRRLEGQE